MDLIASQYGWSDDDILELRIGRVKQIVDTIKERLTIEEAKHKSVVEWQTRSLAGFLTSLSQSKEGAKEMAKAAEKLSLFSDSGGRAQPPTADHLAPADGSAKQSAAKSVKEHEPKSGSFEKLSAMFGGAGTMFQLPASRG